LPINLLGQTGVFINRRGKKLFTICMERKTSAGRSATHEPLSRYRAQIMKRRQDQDLFFPQGVAMSENKDKNQPITVTGQDLPLACPQPDAPLWARHPRVFLDFSKTGEAVCPYCSTRYTLQGEAPKHH
jgi:uncharacterized Zn-finger protein